MKTIREKIIALYKLGQQFDQLREEIDGDHSFRETLRQYFTITRRRGLAKKVSLASDVAWSEALRQNIVVLEWDSGGEDYEPYTEDLPLAIFEDIDKWQQEREAKWQQEREAKIQRQEEELKKQQKLAKEEQTKGDYQLYLRLKKRFEGKNAT
jgi:hypothetical protein